MENKNNNNRLLWLALIGFGVYHLYSKGFRIGKINSDRESKGNGTSASGGGGFVIPILNTRIYKKEEPKVEEPKLTTEPNAMETLKANNSVSEEEVKTALSSIEKQQKINPDLLPTTTMGMGTTTTTTNPKTIDRTATTIYNPEKVALSTSDLSTMKLGSLEPSSNFNDFDGIDFDGDDMDSRQWIID